MKSLSPRQVYFCVIVFCISSVGFALYMQNYEFVLPCPLCIFQRIGIMACGLLAFAAAILPLPRWPRFWPTAISLAAIAGAGISIRHIQIQQSLATDHPQSCGAGLGFMLENQSIPSVISSVLAGHGDCTIIDWQFGFLTLPMMALGGFLLVLLCMLYLIFQSSRAAAG